MKFVSCFDYPTDDTRKCAIFENGEKPLKVSYENDANCEFIDTSITLTDDGVISGIILFLYSNFLYGHNFTFNTLTDTLLIEASSDIPFLDYIMDDIEEFLFELKAAI